MATIAINFDVNDAQAVAGIKRVGGAIDGVKPPSPATAQGFTSIKDRILEVTGVAQKMARVLVSVQVIMASVVAVLGVRQIIAAADAWTMMSSRLSLVESSAQGVIAVQERLFRLAQEVRLPLQDMVQLYSRLAFNSQQLGLNQDQLIAITKAVSQAMQISGSTAQESAAGVMQLTQALASNNLQGDELRSLLESQPRLLKAFADGLNVISPEFKKLTDSGMAATGAIRALAKAGKLDAGLILQALVTQVNALDSEFKKLSRTIGQSWTQVMNQLQQGLKGVNTEPLTRALDRLRAWFADSSTQQSVRNFADGIMKALGSLAESAPKIVGFVQGHVEALMKVFDALAPKVDPLVSVLDRAVKLYFSLPPAVQEMGLVVAMLFGAKGFALFFAGTALLDKFQNSWQALKRGMPLSEFQGSNAEDIERWLKEQEMASLKFRGAQGLGGLPAPSQKDIDAYLKLYEAARKPLDPIKATPKALDDVKKKVHETAGEIAELDATARRMAVGLTLDGTASSHFVADLTPMNVRLADASTLFSDVRVKTQEYSTELTGLSVSLTDAEDSTEGYLISADDLQRSLAQIEPVLMSLEDRLKGQIALFPRTRVEADAYLSTLESVKTTTVDMIKSSSLLETSLDHLFSGISDILSIFGVKLGKFLLLLQNLPRAVSGLREVFAGLGGLMTLGGTSLGAGTAWAETAKSVTALGNASGETAGILGFLSGTVSVVTKLLLLFGNGITWVFSAISQLIQGLASGNVVGSITSIFSSLASAGSGLMSVFSGLSSIGSTAYSALQGVGGLADVFQSVFNAMGLTSGGFATAGQAAGSTLAQVGGAGQFAQLFAEWIPVAGAIYAVVNTLTAFIKGDLARAIGGTVGAAIGAVIGTFVLPGLGTLGGFVIGNIIGSFIGGLFGKTPRAELRARIAPFDRNAIGEAIDTTVPGTQVGGAIVDVGGNILKSKKERALQLALAGALNALLQNVVTAMVGMIKVLPTAIGAQLDAALTQLETTGLEIVDKTWKGGKAGKKFNKRIKGLLDETLQDLVTALDFGDVDLKALGFDPNDKKGKKGGEVARGFEAMMISLGALSAIAKEAGNAVDFSRVTLAEFTAGAIAYFKSFAKEGEAYLDTVKRVMESIGGIIQMRDQIRTRMAAMTGDVSVAFGILADQLNTLHDRTIAAADALTIAAESGATPEEILAAAQATQQALEAELQGVQALKTAVDALNASIITGVDLIVDLTQKIHALQGTELSADEFQAGIDGFVYLFTVMTDVSNRIALFSAGLIGLSGNVALFTANLPLAIAGFGMILEQIRQLENPAQALTALKALAGAIEAGLNAAIAAVNRQTQAQIDALNVQKSAVSSAADAQRRALQDERDQIATTFDARKTALQEELRLAQQWSSVLDSVQAQLTDLFNLLAPTHPLTSFNEVRAQFAAAFAAFQATPTVTAAEQVQELARQVLQLAQGVPGMDLPSAAFQSLAAEVQAALESVRTFAAAQPSQEAIQQQLAALEEEQTTLLTSIDDRLRAATAQESTDLQALDAQIASATAAGQAQIAQFQALAAQGLEAIRAQVYLETVLLASQQAAAATQLQAILGDRTFEQYIAEKQREAVDVLHGIEQTLQAYLGAILTNLFPGAGIPALSEGGVVMPRPGGTLVRLAEAGYPEMVTPMRGGSTSGGGQTTINLSLEVHADSGTDGRKVGREIIQEMKEAILYGELRQPIQQVSRKR